MAKSISDIEKRGRGRPATDATPVMVRVPPDMISGIDAWISGRPDPKPTRPEAVRVALRDWLVGLGLLKSGEESDLN